MVLENNSVKKIISYLSIQLINELSQRFHLAYSLSPLLLITFSTLNCLVCLLQFFFIKRSNNFFTIKITNNMCPRHSIFNLFTHKDLFKFVWNKTFCKNVFIFWYSCIINNIKLRTTIFFFYIKVNICTWLDINRLHFDCAICIVVFIAYIT